MNYKKVYLFVFALLRSSLRFKGTATKHYTTFISRFLQIFFGVAQSWANVRKQTLMQQAIGAYRQVTATDEFKEIERLRSRARHNEASALRHAKAEQTLEIARKALQKNMSVDDVADITGLTRIEVEAIRAAD